MAQVYRWIADMYDPRAHYPDDMAARQYVEAYFPGNEEYAKYVETIITYCFASQTVDTFSAMETKRAIVDALEQIADWGTAVGGTAAIVKGVERAIRDHGGQIATRTKGDGSSAGPEWRGPDRPAVARREPVHGGVRLYRLWHGRGHHPPRRGAGALPDFE